MTPTQKKWILTGLVLAGLVFVAYKKGWIGKKEEPFVIADTSAEAQTRPLKVA